LLRHDIAEGLAKRGKALDLALAQEVSEEEGTASFMAEIVGGEANKYVQCAASGKEWGTGHVETTPDNLMNRRYRKGKWYQKSSLHPSGRQPRRGGTSPYRCTKSYTSPVGSSISFVAGKSLILPVLRIS
jgi:hypothetical protein